MRRFNRKEDAPFGSSWIRISGKFKSETVKALGFEYKDYGTVWFPKSKMYCIDNGVTEINYYVQKWCLVSSNIKIT